MADTKADARGPMSDDELQDLVAAADTGSRKSQGLSRRIILGAALTWSVFQVYIASPLPFMLTELFGTNVFVFGSVQARPIHLAFAVFLGYLSYPAYVGHAPGRPKLFAVLYALLGLAGVALGLLGVAGLGEGLGLTEELPMVFLACGLVLLLLSWPLIERDSVRQISVPDWAVALVAAFCSSYGYWFYDQLAQRPGLPEPQDIVIGCVGLLVLLEATRRALGPPLMMVALVFLTYQLFGDASWVPEVIQWAGASVSKAIGHQYLGTEGVFGIALGVSTDFVFLFVLFGALLDKAGAGNYFIKVAFSLLGHLRGGPAKAAVVSSGMTGLISGSSIANVVTTGTFTIPLMKRVGFTGEKAGAVEVASSVNGQIMPPVMGAAAFLMVEYVGISYVEVVKHAFLPAVISYIALVYIVHLEALKTGMVALPKPGEPKTLPQALISTGIIVCSIIILAGAVYFGVGWTKDVFGAATGWIMGVAIFAVYLGLLWFGARYPELELDDPNAPVVSLPESGPTVKSGLHYILPIVVLVWCLMIERMSPGLSAFWATLLMIFILLTQRPIMAVFRGGVSVPASVAQGFQELIQGLIAGAQNMIGIGIATATAGIIVGTVSQTGIGQVMAEFVELLSLGNVILMLLWVAVLSLILGMGLPTTANYIVVSSLMAPVVVTLGAESGLIVPLIAVHLFVFYFGIMADVTPPVGLASFAAAAVSGADPIKTGFTAFFYSLRTVALPFIFIFNPAIIMIGIEGPVHLVLTVISATLAMLVFAAGTQGYFLTRSRIHESVLLLLVAFIIFRPGYFWHQVFPPFEVRPGNEIIQVADGTAPGTNLTVIVDAENFDTGEMEQRTLVLPLGEGATGAERLSGAGLELIENEQGALVVDNVGFASQAEKIGFDFDQVIASIKLPADIPPKELMWIPALALLGFVVMLQRRRRPSETEAPAGSPA